MTDVKHRDVEFIVKALQVRQDFAFALGVQRGQRFVHQQQFRAGQQGAGHAYALPFTAREVLRVSVQQMADPQ
ncbi:hypothetical protein D3C81_2315050 [compost metagenome]